MLTVKRPGDDDPVDGEIRRVIVLDGHRVGPDAIVEFGDLDRPGLSYRAVVLRGRARDGLGVGDQCLLRYREASPWLARQAGWQFVERTDDAFVDFDAEVAALTEAEVSP